MEGRSTCPAQLSGRDGAAPTPTTTPWKDLRGGQRPRRVRLRRREEVNFSGSAEAVEQILCLQPRTDALQRVPRRGTRRSCRRSGCCCGSPSPGPSAPSGAARGPGRRTPLNQRVVEQGLVKGGGPKYQRAEMISEKPIFFHKEERPKEGKG